MWTYNSGTTVVLHNNILSGKGYSGEGLGLNNPAAEDIHGVGPLPRGRYVIGPWFDDFSRPASVVSGIVMFPAHAGKGPMVAHLTAAAGSETFGRSGFMIHGDNPAGDFTASHGCVVLVHDLRLAMARSGDVDFEVV